MCNISVLFGLIALADDMFMLESIDPSDGEGAEAFGVASRPGSGLGSGGAWFIAPLDIDAAVASSPTALFWAAEALATSAMEVSAAAKRECLFTEVVSFRLDA